MHRALVLTLIVALTRTADATPPSLVLIDRVLATQTSPEVPDLSVLTTEPVARTESSGYGWREDPVSGRRVKFHHGTDYRGKRGTPILAAGAGTVVFAGRRGGYGRIVFVDHGNGVVTRYAHMQKIDVKVGDPVEAGTQLGQLGSSGRTTGAHLHFEVRLDGRSVDPTTAMIVGDITRQNPTFGALAAYTLAPEIQFRARDPHDRRASRPERRGAPKREAALW